jgi:CRISPR-associated protein Cas8a1/Csx13
MGKTVKGEMGARAGPGSLKISLSDPGMTALHKAGLAGLWMSLRALEKDSSAMDRLAAHGAAWKLDKKSVELIWTKNAQAFFDDLLKLSFGIDGHGFFSFPALGDPAQHPQHAVVLQKAVLGSFLQHGRTRKSDPPMSQKGSASYEIDDQPVAVSFPRVYSYAHQSPDFDPAGSNNLAGWLMPGGAVRHVGLGNSTDLVDSPGNALALRYAVVGVIYFEIRKRKKKGGIRPAYALVLPEITDFEKYARARETFVRAGVQQLLVAGAADAGMRVLSHLRAAHLLDDLNAASCRVISFGVVPWSTQQKTRVHLATVRAGSDEGLRLYDLCLRCFAPRLVRPADGSPFWDVPQVPDLVAGNLAAGKRWWEDFSDLLSDGEARDHILGYLRNKKTGHLDRMVLGERGGLAQMVDNQKAMPDGVEKTFVAACHEAWRRRMGRLGERAQREGASFEALVSREFERMRVSFSRCKNATDLRAAVTDFWVRSGSLPALQDNWQGALSLMDEKNWKTGRDLALLAFASYKPATKPEEQALAQVGVTDGAEED